MTTNKSRNVQTRTPGEEPPASQMPPQADEAKAAVNESVEPKGFSDEQQAAIDAEVQRRLEEAENPDQEMIIEAEVQRRLKERRRAQLDKPVVDGDLPAQDKVDPKKIKRAVLTKDGFVCPQPPAEDPRNVRR